MIRFRMSSRRRSNGPWEVKRSLLDQALDRISRFLRFCNARMFWVILANALAADDTSGGTSPQVEHVSVQLNMASNVG